MKSKILGLLATGLLVAQPALATLIIDTGIPGQTELRASVRNIENNAQWEPLWRAGKFEIADAYSLTGFSIWTATVRQGLIRWAIYSDAGNPPGELGFIGDLGTLLWSVESLSPASTNDPAWIGVEDFAFELAAGTYWLALEIPFGEPTFLLRPIGNPADSAQASGTLPPNPLLAEAGTFGSVGEQISWSLSGSRFGYRIYGDMTDAPTSVPEPGTLALLGLGLLGLRISRRRKA